MAEDKEGVVFTPDFVKEFYKKPKELAEFDPNYIKKLWSHFHVASQFNELDRVCWLLHRGADLELKDRYFNQTPLYFNVCPRDTVRKLFISYGAKIHKRKGK